MATMLEWVPYAAGVAAVVHVGFFVLESVIFMRPSIYKRFGAKNEADAKCLRLMALNQGFYNLFLAIGVFVGIWLFVEDGAGSAAAQALILFGCAVMFSAGVTLVVSAREKILPALMQSVPPLVAIVLLLV